MPPLQYNMGAKFYAGRATLDLGSRIANHYGSVLGEVIVTTFSDGEIQPSFHDSVRGQDVFLIQSTTPPAENLMELLLMIDAARRASARKIIAVMPYYGYARQDRKDQPRVAIGAKLVANMLMAAGADRIITMDLHADQIQGFFEVPVDHLFGSTIFIPEIERLKLENMVIAAPDVGGAKRANTYAKVLNCGLALCHKNRKKANEIAEMTVIGEVEGKDVIIIDDMCDTAGTLTASAALFMDNGAASVRAFCTHAVLSGPAFERVESSMLTELVVTDTIPHERKSPKIRTISVDRYFASVIDRLLKNESIGGDYYK